MATLSHSINVTLDGCCDHLSVEPDEHLHRHATGIIERADVLLFGRVTYQMMEGAWRSTGAPSHRPDWMEPFARTIDAKKKYVVSSTLDRVDWNAELVRGDLRSAIERLKRETSGSIYVGGVTLPRALSEWGLIDEYELLVHPRIAGRGPSLFAGMSKPVDLRLVSHTALPSGAVAMRYRASANAG